jgi:hypothetical protein
MRIARRPFLLSLLTIGALSVPGLRPALALSPEPAPPARLARTLAMLVPERESARRIGKAYLAVKPEEADLERLIALLCPRREDRQCPPREQLRRLLAVRHDDFCDGRIVRLQGWIIPATEARLCALVALGAPARGVA